MTEENILICILTLIVIIIIVLLLVVIFYNDKPFYNNDKAPSPDELSNLQLTSTTCDKVYDPFYKPNSNSSYTYINYDDTKWNTSHEVPNARDFADQNILLNRIIEKLYYIDVFSIAENTPSSSIILGTENINSGTGIPSYINPTRDNGTFRYTVLEPANPNVIFSGYDHARVAVPNLATEFVKAMYYGLPGVPLNGNPIYSYNTQLIIQYYNPSAKHDYFKAFYVRFCKDGKNIYYRLQ